MSSTNKDELKQLSERNNTRLQMLGAQGAQFNPLELINLRLEVLTQYLFLDNEDRMDGFEMMWAKRFESILDEADKQVAKAKLTQGVSDFKMPENPRDN